MEGLEITITNYSNVVWTRNNWHVGAGQSDEKNWTDEITQIPAESIQKRSGQTTAAVHSEHLTTVATDALWVILGYGSEEGNFAVKLQQYFHMFGQGSQDEWAYWDDSKKSWTELTNKAEVRIWTFENTEIRATPTLNNTSASVSIVITDRR